VGQPIEIFMPSLIKSPEITPDKLPSYRRRAGGLLQMEKGLLQIARFTHLRLSLKAKEKAGKGLPKNREMKEGPTMLLITKDRRFPAVGLAARIGNKDCPAARVQAYFGSYPSARRPGLADIAKDASCRKMHTNKA
jgi:hypothetical protein